MGRRKHEAELSLVAQQQQTIAEQSSRIQYLEARQIDGPNAHWVEAIEGAINSWVMNGRVRELTTGDSDGEVHELEQTAVTGHEIAIHDGLRDAARVGGLQAIESLSPEKKLEFAKERLDEETFTRIAVAGLASMLYRDPVRTLAALPWPERSKLIETLVKDPDAAEKLTIEAVNFAAKAERTNVSHEKMQRDFDDFGYIDTSELAIGDRVRFEYDLYSDNRYRTYSVKGRVVSLEEAGTFIQPLEGAFYPVNRPFLLGRIDPNKVFNTQAMPGARIDVAVPINVGVKKAENYYEIYTNGANYISSLYSLTINGNEIKLDED
jgi:hypothetical protein